MTQSRILSVGLLASALAIAPMSSALAGGPHWSHGAPYHAPAYHAGYRGGYYGHGGSGYWHGSVWWPAAAAVAVMEPPLRWSRRPSSRSATRWPAPPTFRRRRYYGQQDTTLRSSSNTTPAGYSAPQQQCYAPQGYNAPRYNPAVPPDCYAQRRRDYNNAQPAPTYAPPPQGITGRRRRTTHRHTIRRNNTYYRQPSAATVSTATTLLSDAARFVSRSSPKVGAGAQAVSLPWGAEFMTG
jgi:hypothetical protein